MAWLLGGGAFWAGRHIASDDVTTATRRTTQSNVLCQKCRGLSLDQMRGPDCDRMQPHQPNYLALKRSANGSCALCRFILTALGQSVSIDGIQGTDVLDHISDKYPGREISLAAWAGGSPDSFLDRVAVITTGEIPDASTDGSDYSPEDPTLHPDYQCALSGTLDIFTYPGKHSHHLIVLSGRAGADRSQMIRPHGMVVLPVDHYP